MSKSFLKSSGIFTAMTFISRVFGLIRDQIIAIFFGANALTDAFFVAFKIPNFFRRLFGEGAFSQAFVPILAEAKASNDKNEVNLVINHIGTKFLKVLIVTTIIFVIASPIVIAIFAWGFYIDPDPTKYDAASMMLRITFPYLLFIGLTAFAGSILNSYERFAAPAFTPVILNISIIIFAYYSSDWFSEPIIALALGVFVGGLLQLLFQIPFLLKLGKFPKIVKGDHPSESLLKKRMIPALFGVSVSQINLLVDTIVASFLISGSVTWLYYSDRLMELPLALIGIAIATVALSKLSNYFAQNDNENFIKTIDSAIKYFLIFGIPSSIGLMLLAEEIVITLFQYNEFTPSAALQSSRSLIAYGAGLTFFILVKIFATIFLSRGDTKTPVKVGIVAMLSNIILNIILAYYFSHVGIATATSLSALLNSYLLYFYLRKESIEVFSQSNKVLFLKVIFSILAMGIAVLVTVNPIDYFYSGTIFERVSNLLLTISLAGIVYFLALKSLRIRLTS